MNTLAPWHKRYSVGAFAADSIVRLLDNSVETAIAPFSSNLLKQLVRLRWGFTFDIPPISSSNEEAKFAGAVLSKIAQRGFPAPCSIDLERNLLKAAKETGVIKYWREIHKAGAFIFLITPEKGNFKDLVKCIYFSELIIDENEVKQLLNFYSTLCTSPEKEFFEKFIKTCPSPHLALYLVPQRPLRTMIRLTRREEELKGFISEGRVDFAIELPILEKGKYFRLVIEIDDTTHSGIQKEKDLQRDTILNINGWKIIRLKTKEKTKWEEEIKNIVQSINNVIGESIFSAIKEFQKMSKEEWRALNNLVLLPIAEAQLSVIISRWLHTKGSANIRIATPQNLDLDLTLKFINNCLDNLEKLYNLSHLGRPSITNEENADILYFLLPSWQALNYLNFDTPLAIMPTFVFSEYEDSLLENTLPRPISDNLEEQDLKASLTYFLQQIFRKEKFWTGQVEIISHSLKHKPIVGVLPTAAGKSICYQLTSLLQPGFSIVIQPLRSLILDQQYNLDTMGIQRSTAIISQAEVTSDEEIHLKEEGYNAIEKGFRYFAFISPERLQIPEFRENIKKFVERYPIPYCVVDEAHCVSEWGHDFRPAYLNLGRLIPELCNYRGYKPNFIALTATASQNVLTDILRELNIKDLDAIIMPENFDRSELKFTVFKVSPGDRFIKLQSLLKDLIGYRPGQPLTNVPSGLVFTYFAKERELGVINVKKEILKELPDLNNLIEFYSGDKPPDWKESKKDWELHKITLQQKFKKNEIPILVCTHSFGMGIDKPDIRFTIHVMLPRSLEEFYQQAGRAGRDGKESHCYIIFADPQPELANEILDPLKVPIEKTREYIEAEKIPPETRGDVLRNIWFLQNSFLGKEQDKKIIDYVWNHLSSLLPDRQGDKVQRELLFSFLPNYLFAQTQKNISPENKMQALEKAIYRLLAIGAVDDYGKDYVKGSFIIYLSRKSLEDLKQSFKDYLCRYATEGEIQAYLPKNLPSDYKELVRICAHQVIEFVYDKIERRRRRAMWEMLQAARDYSRLGEERFREQLNSYMSESEYTQPVKNLSSRILPDEWFNLIDKAEGVDGLTKLFGACRRQLEEFPEHPGLLLLTGFCRFLYSDEGTRDIGNAFLVLKERYSDINRCNIAEKLIEILKKRFPTKVDKALDSILEKDQSREMAQFCYINTTPYSNAYVRAFLILVKELLISLEKIHILQTAFKDNKKRKLKISKARLNSEMEIEAD